MVGRSCHDWPDARHDLVLWMSLQRPLKTCFSERSFGSSDRKGTPRASGGRKADGSQPLHYQPLTWPGCRSRERRGASLSILAASGSSRTLPSSCAIRRRRRRDASGSIHALSIRRAVSVRFSRMKITHTLKGLHMKNLTSVSSAKATALHIRLRARRIRLRLRLSKRQQANRAAGNR